MQLKRKFISRFGEIKKEGKFLKCRIFFQRGNREVQMPSWVCERFLDDEARAALYAQWQPKQPEQKDPTPKPKPRKKAVAKKQSGSL